MTSPRRNLPPAILSFLAPAKRCNQRCPQCYLTEVVDEPVRVAALTPSDFAGYVEHFVTAGIPVLSTIFQGYEVTLPQSWPYLEAVFAVAARYDIGRSFITNGMLLHKHAARIAAYEPVGIAVSLDGASPETNDPLRGLPGSFVATVESIQKLSTANPSLRERLSVASCLYGTRNHASLLDMPNTLARLGIRTWRLSVALTLEHETVVSALPLNDCIEQMLQLQQAAGREGINCHVNDEFGLLRESDTGELRVERLFEPDWLYRLDPLGTVRVGAEMLRRWTPESARRWDPKRDDAVEASGYWSRDASFAQSETDPSPSALPG